MSTHGMTPSRARTRPFRAASLSLVLVFALAACGSQGDAGPTSEQGNGQAVDQVSFLLDFIPKGQTSPFLLALDKGFWAKRGLSVQVSRGYGSSDTAVRVGAGEAQFGFAGVSATMNAISEGLPLIEVAAIAHTLPTATYALPEAGVVEHADLAGKTIVTNPVGENLAVFTAYCAATDLDCERDVEWLYSEQAGLAQLTAGQGDIILTWITDLGEWWLQEPPLEPTNIWLGRDLGIYGNGIIANSELVEEDPDLVRRFVEGALEGYQYILQGGESAQREAIAALFKYYPELKDAENAEELHLANLKLFLSLMLAPEVEETGIGYFETEKTKRTLDFVNGYLLEEPLELEQAFNVDPQLIESGEFPVDFDKAREALTEVLGRPNPVLNAP